MMMTDMLPGQRESVRQLHAPSLEAALETDDYELLEIVPLLWTGWECDTHAALVRVEGRTRIVILDPVHALEPRALHQGSRCGGGGMNEEVRGYIEFVRKRWPHVIEGMTDPEEVGRHPSSPATSAAPSAARIRQAARPSKSACPVPSATGTEHCHRPPE
jgi:hypothetical protein